MINILFIDKNPVKLRLGAKQLQTISEEARVITAQSRSEAIRMLKSQRFDAIVHGIDSGGRSEIHLSRSLLQNKGSLPTLTILFGASHEVEPQIEKGEYDHILKVEEDSVDYNTVYETLVRLIEKNRESTDKSILEDGGADQGSGEPVNLEMKQVADLDSYLNVASSDTSRTILLLNAEGAILFSSSSEELAGLYSAFSEVRQRNFAELFSGRPYSRVKMALEKAREGYKCDFKIHFPAESQNQKLWEINLTPVVSGQEGEVFIVVSLVDISASAGKLKQELIVTSNSQLKLMAKLFEKTVEGVTITDADARILQVNPAFSVITGYSPSEVIGKNPRVLKSDRHEPEFYDNMWQSIIKRGEWSGEIWNRRKDGDAYPEWLTIFAIKDGDGAVSNYIAIFHDLTEIKQSREQIAFKTYHDSLTGLPNRSYFSSRLRMALAKATRKESSLALLVLDLDNFKQINESYGHPAGDDLVQQLAERLEECIRQDDTIARIGGDEFAIFCEDIENVKDVVALASRIINRMKEPFSLDGFDIFASVSIGITVYPTDGLTESELMKNADMALFKAKELGKKQFYFYTTKLHKSIARRMEIESSLRRALYNNEFLLHYQPKIDCRTGKVAGFESLMRWNSPNKGFVRPDEFIPVLEDIGYITEVGLWALETACRDIRSLHKAGNDHLTIAVNLSAKQLEDPWLVKNLKGVLNRTGFPPEKLTLEITESTIMNNVDIAIEKMEALSDLGIRISIDDFGTGYSSLSYLKRFPVDELKIDRSFIMDIPKNDEDMVICRAIVSLAKSLELDVVAEGVETEDQERFLTTLGCTQMQGYYFSKPVALNKVRDYLETRNSETDKETVFERSA